MPFSRSFPFWKSQSSTKDTAPPEYPQTDALVAAAAGMDLTPDNWDEAVAGKTIFVKFLAPW